MAKITIDGKTAEVKDGITILQAAEALGIDIPHFCYHPALSISGNCRMCLVEVEKMPKLVIACATRVMDGMVVYTQNEKVKKARQAVLEFILINHPLDCPICDEAGECKLQNYTYIYGPGHSRFDEEKVHKPTSLAPVELGVLSALIRKSSSSPSFTWLKKSMYFALRTDLANFRKAKLSSFVA